MSTRLSRTVLTLVLVAAILTLTPLAHADHLIPPGSPESGTMMTLMMWSATSHRRLDCSLTPSSAISVRLRFPLF